MHQYAISCTNIDVKQHAFGNKSPVESTIKDVITHYHMFKYAFFTPLLNFWMLIQHFQEKLITPYDFIVRNQPETIRILLATLGAKLDTHTHTCYLRQDIGYTETIKNRFTLDRLLRPISNIF